MARVLGSHPNSWWSAPLEGRKGHTLTADRSHHLSGTRVTLKLLGRRARGASILAVSDSSSISFCVGSSSNRQACSQAVRDSVRQSGTQAGRHSGRQPVRQPARQAGRQAPEPCNDTEGAGGVPASRPSSAAELARRHSASRAQQEHHSSPTKAHEPAPIPSSGQQTHQQQPKQI